MRKKIPSLSALTVFESAARLQSFTRAADELSLTQSAVCRQIANLEEWLGLELFARIKKRVLLTPAGQEYATRIRGHLDRIERDTLELMGSKEGAGVLELAVIPTFASQWLIPRLAQFNQERPDITIHLSTKTRPFLFSETLFHAAIHSGQHAWPGTQGDFLIPEDEAIVVCSPNFYQQHFEDQAISVEQLSDKPLLHLSSRLEDWRTWFELQQCSNDVLAVKGARFELFTMLYQAAMAGLGLALIPRYMVQAELDQGHLLNPIAASLPSDTAYFLSYPEEHAQHGPLLAFKEWLLEQTQTTDPS